MSILLRPYGLFLFALLYNICLRGTITYCEYWNPLADLADLLITDPVTEKKESQSDGGLIHYPLPIISVADLLLNDPSPTSSSSDSSDSSEDDSEHSLDSVPDTFNVNTFFNNYIDHIKDKKVKDEIIKSTRDFILNNIPATYWSQTIDDYQSPIHILDHNLSNIGDLSERNKIALKFLRVTILTQDTFQASHLQHEKSFYTLWDTTLKML